MSVARDSSPIRRTDAEEVEVALEVEATFVEMEEDARNAATSCADKAKRPNSCKARGFISECEDESRYLIEFLHCRLAVVELLAFAHHAAGMLYSPGVCRLT